MCFCIFFITYRGWSKLQREFGQVRVMEFIYRVPTVQKGDIIMSDLFYHFFTFCYKIFNLGYFKNLYRLEFSFFMFQIFAYIIDKIYP